MPQSITGLVIGITAFFLAWKLGVTETSPGKRIAPTPRSRLPLELPWPKSRDLSHDEEIRARLSAKDWFSMTDVARALQKAPRGRRPSGSAGRDARTLLNRWLHQGIVEVGRFGPSGRRFFRFA